MCSQCDYDRIDCYYNSAENGGHLHFYDEGELTVNENSGCGEIVYTYYKLIPSTENTEMQ